MTRYRCAACGNLTRFDVTSTATTRAFYHFTLGGELEIEDEEVIDRTLPVVRARAIDRGDRGTGALEQLLVVMTTSDPASRVPNPEHLVAVPMFLGSRPERARPVTGVTLSGESVVHRLDDPWTLLLFVSTACDGCLELWDELVRAHATLPTAVTLLVVVHGSGEDASALSDRARSAPVVMSEQAWEDYGVHSPPF